MRRRKDSDQEMMQQVLEELLMMLEDTDESMLEMLGDMNSELVPDYIQVEVSKKLTGMQMLPDEEKIDLAEMIQSLEDRDDAASEKETYRVLRGKIRDFILQQPERYLAALPASTVDAVEALLNEKQVRFDDWIDDVLELASAGFCIMKDGPRAIVPEEYAKVYRPLLEDERMQNRLEYWRNVEERSADLLVDAGGTMTLQELTAKLKRTVKEEGTASGADRGKVISLNDAAQQKSQQDEWLEYVLTHRLDSWYSEIVVYEDRQGQVHFEVIDWDDEMDDLEFEFDEDDFDGEFDDEDYFDDDDDLLFGDDDDDLPFGDDDEDYFDDDEDLPFGDDDDDESDEDDDAPAKDAVLWIDIGRFQNKP